MTRKFGGLRQGVGWVEWLTSVGRGSGKLVVQRSDATGITGTPSGGGEAICPVAHPLPPLGGVEWCWGGRDPGVSLRSPPGYDLCSLREQCLPGCCVI
jgi:hypothetical protein